jgi:hypothetical protein
VSLEPCPWCDGLNCEARFHAYLVHDFTDPEYGAVHHLVVATYMLQHDVYDPDTLETMLEFVTRWMHDVPSDHDRRSIRAAFDGSNRAVNRDRLPPVSPRAWTMTVLDVDDSSSESYRRTVRAWARSVLETLHPEFRR